MSVKSVLAYMLGITPAKNIARDIKRNFCGSGLLIADTIKLIKESAEDQKTDWLDDSEKFFDQVCREKGTTTASVKATYLGHFLAGWSFLILWVWSCWVAFSHSSHMNMMLMTAATASLSALSEYRMFVAREQRIIHPVNFLRMFISTPNLWVPIWLPRNYKLRIER